MEKNIEILDESGSVENQIIADEDFAELHFPGRWRIADDQPQPAPPDARRWWLDVGPFKDRLGMDGMAIASSDHRACRAVIEMLNGRKYVDLTDPKTAAMLGLLKATAQPAAEAMFPGAGPMTDAKIAAILTTPTTEVERHIKGL